MNVADVICSSCWTRVDAFHQFYVKVETVFQQNVLGINEPIAVENADAQDVENVLEKILRSNDNNQKNDLKSELNSSVENDDDFEENEANGTLILQRIWFGDRWQ